MNKLIWKHTNLYCPKCGEKTVVEVPDVFEDNAGSQRLCYSCEAGFMYPEEEEREDYCVLSEIQKRELLEEVKGVMAKFWMAINEGR